METNHIYQGHVLDVLKTFPDECIDTCITSPPYFNLRSYGTGDVEWEDGWKGSLGLEPTPYMYIDHLIVIFREVRRVLKKGSTFWVVIGDSFCANSSNAKPHSRLPGNRIYARNPIGRSSAYRDDILKPKDMMAIPWRLGLALQGDGWWLRSDIILSKRNPMPDSAHDRPAKSHEYILLLSKSSKYYYDAKAIRESTSDESLARAKRGRSETHKYVDGAPGQSRHTLMHDMSKSCDPSGRNKRSVWEVTTQPSSLEHFAAFAPKWIEPCVLAGCPKQVCRKCGEPRVPIYEKGEPDEEWRRRCGADSTGHYTGQAVKDYGPAMAQNASDVKRRILEGMRKKKLVGHTDCGCGMGFSPGVILDPFMGTGTTGLVAKKHARQYIGIELGEKYVKMAEKRLAQLTIFEMMDGDAG